MNQTPAHYPEIEAELEEARAELERRVRAGTLHQVEELRGQFPRVWSDPECALELAYSEYVLRKANGEAPQCEDWYHRFPEWRERLERLFGLHDLFSDRDTLRNRSDSMMPVVSSVESVDRDDHPTGYELFEELGRGGMAVVYRARQRDLNRIVALKVLRGGEWFESEDVARLRDEAEAVAKLHHPNIVQIHMIGDWDGVPFLAMEYVDGGTLGEFLTQNQRQGTLGVSPLQAAELVATLARTMQYAHDHGIIHRDLKPANVLLHADADRPFAEPKIADFGLAIREDVSIAITQTARLAGTPCYMAPEQADSRRDAIGPKTDVYALGGILYELLTGRPPFQAATVLETLDLVRSAEPVPPRTLQPHVPRDLETICLKCLQKVPDRRYPTANALAEDIDNFREGRPIVARPVSGIEKCVKAMKRYPLVSGLAVLIIGLMAVSMGLLYGLYRTSETARIQEQHLRGELEATRAQELIASANSHWVNGEVIEAKRLLMRCPEEYRTPEWLKLYTNAFAEEGSTNVEVYGTIAASPTGKYVIVQFGVAGSPHVIDRITGKTVAKMNTSLPILRGIEYYFPQGENKIYSIPTATSIGLAIKSVRDTTVPQIEELDLVTKIGRQIRPFQPNRRLAFCRSHGIFAIHNPKEQSIAIWNMLEDRIVSTISIAANSELMVYCFCAGNTNLLSLHKREITCWDSMTGKQIWSSAFGYKPVISSGVGSPGADLIYFRERMTLALPSATRYEVIRAWNTKQNKEEFCIECPESFEHYKLDSTGTLLAVSVDRQIKIYDARTGEFHVALRASKSGTPTFDFLPDHRLVSVSNDMQLKTWNLSAWARPSSPVMTK